MALLVENPDPLIGIRCNGSWNASVRADRNRSVDNALIMVILLGQYDDDGECPITTSASMYSSSFKVVVVCCLLFRQCLRYLFDGLCEKL